MNPMTNVKNTQKLNETELELGLTGSTSSWHADFKDSAWIFIGGLPYDLSEGDVICVFSQYGEVVHINLVRDKQSGKSKGFCFLCYEDQRSTILAVDNLNSTKILSRTLRVNHVADYKMPKEHEEDDDVTRKLRDEGCAPQIKPEEEHCQEEEEVISKKHKKAKKKLKKKKKKKRRELESNSDKEITSESAGQGSPDGGRTKVKHERFDRGYEPGARSSDEDRVSVSYCDDSKSRKHSAKVKYEDHYIGSEKRSYDGHEKRSHDSYGGREKRSRDSYDDHEKESRDSTSRSEEYDREIKREPNRSMKIQYSENARYHKHGQERYVGGEQYVGGEMTDRDDRHQRKYSNDRDSSRDRHSSSMDRYSTVRDVKESDKTYSGRSRHSDISRDMRGRGSGYHDSLDGSRSKERTNRDYAPAAQSSQGHSPEGHRSRYNPRDYSPRDSSPRERSHERSKYRHSDKQKKQDKIKIVVEIHK